MQVYVYDIYVKKLEILMKKKDVLEFHLTHAHIHTQELIQFRRFLQAHSRICNNFSSRYVCYCLRSEKMYKTSFVQQL